MSRDLEDAIHALRSLGDGDADADDGTRERVLGSLERRGRTRRTMTSIAVVMALCLSGTTVWGMASGWIPAVVRTIVGSEPAKVGPADEQSPAARKKTKRPKHGAAPAMPASEPAATPEPEAAAAPPEPAPAGSDAYASAQTDAHASDAAASDHNYKGNDVGQSPRTDAYASMPAASPRPRATVPHASSGTRTAYPAPPVILPEHPRAPAHPQPAPASPPPAPVSAPEPKASPTPAAATPEPVPSDPELALFRTAHAAHFKGSSAAKALAAWDAYLRAFPNGALAPEARWNRALALVRLGRKADALAALAPFATAAIGSYRQAEAQKLSEALRAR